MKDYCLRFSMRQDADINKCSHLLKSNTNVDIFYSGDQEGLACAEEVKVKVKKNKH